VFRIEFRHFLVSANRLLDDRRPPIALYLDRIDMQAREQQVGVLAIGIEPQGLTRLGFGEVPAALKEEEVKLAEVHVRIGRRGVKLNGLLIRFDGFIEQTRRIAQPLDFSSQTPGLDEPQVRLPARRPVGSLFLLTGRLGGRRRLSRRIPFLALPRSSRRGYGGQHNEENRGAHLLGFHLSASMDTPSIAARLGWRGNRDRMLIEGLVPSMSIRLSLAV
jgi:hypothetical protein